MSLKLTILDKIIDIEDRLESEARERIPNQVIEEIKKLYGDFGVEVAKVYYKNENLDTESDKEDCPECAEKAKQLIKLMKVSQNVTTALTDDGVEKVYNHLKKDVTFTEAIDRIVSGLPTILEDGDIKLTPQILKLCIIKELALTDFKQ